MKKKQLIKDLRVTSFVTELASNDSKTVQGGRQTAPNCPESDFRECDLPTKYCIFPTDACRPTLDIKQCVAW